MTGRPLLRWHVPAMLLAAGCAAKSTVALVKAEQEVHLAADDGAPEKAVYEWTKADQYIKKAREEWGTSDYEAADKLAAEASDWADKASQKAQQVDKQQQLEQMPEQVPEQVDKSKQENQGLTPKDEDLKVDLDDSDSDTTTDKTSGDKGD